MFFPFVIYAEFFLIVPRRAEMFNLGKMKSDSGAGSGSAVPSAASKPATVDVGASTVEKRPSTKEGVGLRKCLRKRPPNSPPMLRGALRGPPLRRKGVVELEEVPERGYTLRELCEVEDQAGADRYFTSIMTRL
ncbi:hypothetical protein GW17_00016980 [Ensete ventricosum]|nr:hypothetical protein GW17_00016980 [Ensete ventricosum]